MLQVPASAWTPSVEPEGQVRDGGWVAELARDVPKGRPKQRKDEGPGGRRAPRACAGRGQPTGTVSVPPPNASVEPAWSASA